MVPMHKTEPTPRVLRKVPDEVPAEILVEEATMQLAVGAVIDDWFAGQLEAVSRNPALPQALRARALALLCRFG